MFGVSRENIIDFIIEQIDDGFYPVLDLDFNVFYNIHDADEKIHKALVYGYDKGNKWFFMSMINNGTFKEEAVPFDVFMSAYGGPLSYFNKKDIESLIVENSFMALLY